MIKIEQKENCSGCYACVNICPKGCIRMEKDFEGFWYPKVDERSCIKCGLCKKSCPILTKKEGIEAHSTAFAAINKDNYIREKSSSGGIFTLLAEYVIDRGGVVFGAAFNSAFEVEHICVNQKEDLEKLRGSKYVQSRIGATYSQAKQVLKTGRLVLYTGTPCQIAGLLQYLGKDYENLYTQDFICHGVPSPLAWEEYLKCRKAQAKSSITAISFRDKSEGWNDNVMRIEFANGETYIGRQKEDWFRRAFLGNIALRPACYDCKFKGESVRSDITLGDFWGIEEVLPQMYDQLGTSLVCCNTEKGKNLFEYVIEKIECLSVPYEKAVEHNMCALKPSRKPGSRNFFFKKLKRRSFDQCAELFLEEKHKKKLQFWEDQETVRKEKGKLFALIWSIKNKKNYK